MEQLLKRIKTDVTKFTTAIKKEGDTLLQKINSFNLKEGLQKTKKQLEEKALENYKKFEPTRQKILTDLSLRVKKITSDVSHTENKVKKTEGKKTTQKAKKVAPKKKTVGKKTKPLTK